VTVEAVGGGNQAANDNQWRLPTFDPRNETKYLYKLHTLDIYFWEQEDALLFLNAIRRVLPQSQLAIRDEPVAPPAAHREEMSPIVQQLENVAISDPLYQQGRTKDSRPSAQTAQTFPGPSSAAPTQAAPSFPEPPKSASPSSLGHPAPAPPQAEQPPPQFAPMAYNPAAPAAPEQIKHREKTPPPEDGAVNPLAAAALSDQGQRIVPPGFNQFAPPPPSALTHFPGPPQLGQANSPYAQPPSQPVQRTQSFPQNTQGYNPNAQFMPQQATYHASPPGYSSPMQSPGFPPPPQFSQAPGPPPAPPTGSSYSSYQYSQAQAPPSANDYSIHHQVYRPTEGEAAVKYKPAKEPRGKLEDSAVKLEKGVTGLLKKLEKKIG
jgi:hypothetical protein